MSASNNAQNPHHLYGSAQKHKSWCFYAVNTDTATTYSAPIRKSLDSTHSHQLDETASFQEGSAAAPLPEPRLPDLDLPQSELDLTTTFESILAESTTVADTIEQAEPE